MELVWVIPLGLVVGIALGSLGAGGSILTVPALVYLLGQSPAAATTGSLIIVGITSAVAVIPHARAGNVRLGRGLLFGAVGVVGSLLGAYLAGGVPPHVLLSAFAVLMFVVAWMMWHRARRTAPASGAGAEVTKPILVVLTASLVGLLTGFFGVGGGFAVVPALVLALGLPMTAAVGTSLVVIIINSATALAGRIGSGFALDWPVILGFAVVAAVGSVAGQRLSKRVSPQTLTYAFVAMLVAVGAYMGIMNIPALFTP